MWKFGDDSLSVNLSELSKKEDDIRNLTMTGNDSDIAAMIKNSRLKTLPHQIALRDSVRNTAESTAGNQSIFGDHFKTRLTWTETSMAESSKEIGQTRPNK